MPQETATMCKQYMKKVAFHCLHLLFSTGMVTEGLDVSVLPSITTTERKHRD